MADPITNVLASFNQQIQAASMTAKGLNSTLSTFGAAVAKTTAGIVALGAAALEGGFKTLSTTIQYFVAVVGSVATPVFAVLAAIILTVADMFRDQLLNAARNVAAMLANNVVPQLQTMANVIGAFVDVVDAGMALLVASFKATQVAIAAFVEWMLSFIPGGRSNQEIVAGAAADFGAIFLEWEKKMQDIDQRLKGRNVLGVGPGGAGGAGGGDFAAKLADNLEAVIQDLQKNLGDRGNVGFSAIGDIGKTIQQQAFQSNIQQRLLDTQLKNLGVLREMLVELRKPQPAAVGR